MNKSFILLLLSFILTGCNLKNIINEDGNLYINHSEIPKVFSDLISEITVQDIGDVKPDIEYKVIDSATLKVSLSFDLKEPKQQDDWRVSIKPNFVPDFYWSPHLSPSDEYVVSQHAFRAPAIIMANTKQFKRIVMMPDISLIKENDIPWYMDMDAKKNEITTGWSNTKVKEHVLWVREKGASYKPEKRKFSFFLKATETPKDVKNPWRDIASFYWDNYGTKLLDKKEPLGRTELETYAEHTYNWAFNTWKHAVWQEFELNGKKVGAPAFIVNISQSPNYEKEPYEREFRSIWNQAWFSSLRSASGLYRYARRTNNQDLLEKAKMTKELALSFPKNKGFFPGVIATEMENIKKDGKSYAKSKGWGTYYFGNSNRNPYQDKPFETKERIVRGKAHTAPMHILDMSWTAYLMLEWYQDLERDQRLLDYAADYANALINIQDDKGYFPGWISDELKPLGILDQSPESSMSVTFLLKIYEITGKEAYKTAALKCMNAIIDEVIPVGRWEDFETYWSCSSYGKNTLVNKKVERNDMFKQNTLSMFWTAEALFNTYKLTNESRYMELGQRTLDELLMAQAVWQPPFMYVKTLGGFGVMNVDGEWNDSRQSLFAELIIRYGKELNNEEYIERGLAALRSSFIMMYCPENPVTKIQWEARHPHFGPEDYGFMMENYGHNGYTSREGMGIGVFTIYDWGNGAATEAYNRIRDHYGKEFVEQ